MKIAGLQKTSLIDYPDYLTAVVFTQGCNFRCPYCHNSSLVPQDKAEQLYLPTEELLAFLDSRRQLLDGVTITGGEPTLQTELKEFILELKKMGFLVKLDTNGSNPGLIKDLIQKKAVDYIAMDIKAPLEKYPQIVGKQIKIENIRQSIAIILQSQIKYEFRTTVVPSLHQKDDFIKIGQLIKGAQKYYIQNFRPHNTLNPDFLKLQGFPAKVLLQFKEGVQAFVQEVAIRD